MGDSDLGYIRVSRFRHRIVCRAFYFWGKVGILDILEGFCSFVWFLCFHERPL